MKSRLACHHRRGACSDSLLQRNTARPYPDTGTNSLAIISIIRIFRTEWWYYTGNLKSADGRGLDSN